MKYVQNVDPRAQPPRAEYTQMDVELKWDFEDGMFVVSSFTRGFMCKCYPEAPFTSHKHRYPSFAMASTITSPHEVNTEDDVLHIKNLPSFEDSLSQSDSE